MLHTENAALSPMRQENIILYIRGIKKPDARQEHPAIKYLQSTMSD